MWNLLQVRVTLNTASLSNLVGSQLHVSACVQDSFRFMLTWKTLLFPLSLCLQKDDSPPHLQQHGEGGELNEFTSDPVTGQGYPQLWVLTVHSKKKWEELNFSGCNFCAPRCNLKIKLAFRSAHMFLRSLVSMTLLLRRWPIPSLLTSFRATRPE